MKNSTFVLIGVLLFCAQAVPSSAGEAAEIYKAKCAACHGKDRKGNPAMAKMFKVEPAALDLTGKATLSKSDADLAKVTSSGKGKMPAYKGKLTDAEIGALAAYLKGGSAPAVAQAADAAAKQNAPVENSIYKANCVSCHGKDKKGNAGLAKMFKVEPAALDLTNTATQAKSDEELFKITSDGKGKMPAYKGKLDKGQIEELVRFIKPAAVKSEPQTTGSEGQYSSSSMPLSGDGTVISSATGRLTGIAPDTALP